jgi:hypothetical protein
MLDQQQDVGQESARGQSALYRRPMPGGGYVDVEMEVVREHADGTGRAYGRLILERRSDQSRRTGHQPPVVAEVSGDDVDEVLAHLFSLAQDNAALARSLMRWQSARARAD